MAALEYRASIVKSAIAGDRGPSGVFGLEACTAYGQSLRLAGLRIHLVKIGHVLQSNRLSGKLNEPALRQSRVQSGVVGCTVGPEGIVPPAKTSAFQAADIVPSTPTLLSIMKAALLLAAKA